MGRKTPELELYMKAVDSKFIPQNPQHNLSVLAEAISHITEGPCFAFQEWAKEAEEKFGQDFEPGPRRQTVAAPYKDIRGIMTLDYCVDDKQQIQVSKLVRIVRGQPSLYVYWLNLENNAIQSFTEAIASADTPGHALFNESTIADPNPEIGVEILIPEHIHPFASSLCSYYLTGIPRAEIAASSGLPNLDYDDPIKYQFDPGEATFLNCSSAQTLEYIRRAQWVGADNPLPVFGFLMTFTQRLAQACMIK